jgi:antitoxin MazE
MKARIVKIGNSRGIRIPKPLMEQTGLGEEVEIVVDENRLVIAPLDAIRSGWADAFKRMSDRGDDELLDAGRLPPTRWEGDEWEW